MNACPPKQALTQLQVHAAQKTCNVAAWFDGPQTQYCVSDPPRSDLTVIVTNNLPVPLRLEFSRCKGVQSSPGTFDGTQTQCVEVTEIATMAVPRWTASQTQTFTGAQGVLTSVVALSTPTNATTCASSDGCDMTCRGYVGLPDVPPNVAVTLQMDGFQVQITATPANATNSATLTLTTVVPRQPFAIAYGTGGPVAHSSVYASVFSASATTLVFDPVASKLSNGVAKRQFNVAGFPVVGQTVGTPILIYPAQASDRLIFTLPAAEVVKDTLGVAAPVVDAPPFNTMSSITFVVSIQALFAALDGDGIKWRWQPVFGTAAASPLSGVWMRLGTLPAGVGVPAETQCVYFRVCDKASTAIQYGNDVCFAENVSPCRDIGGVPQASCLGYTYTDAVGPKNNIASVCATLGGKDGKSTYLSPEDRAAWDTRVAAHCAGPGGENKLECSCYRLHDTTVPIQVVGGGTLFTPRGFQEWFADTFRGPANAAALLNRFECWWPACTKNDDAGGALTTSLQELCPDSYAACFSAIEDINVVDSARVNIEAKCNISAIDEKSGPSPGPSPRPQPGPKPRPPRPPSANTAAPKLSKLDIIAIVVPVAIVGLGVLALVVLVMSRRSRQAAKPA